LLRFPGPPKQAAALCAHARECVRVYVRVCAEMMAKQGLPGGAPLACVFCVFDHGLPVCLAQGRGLCKLEHPCALCVGASTLPHRQAGPAKP